MGQTSETSDRKDGCAPQMSIVLVTPDRYDHISKVIEHLWAQSVLEQLEIIIVAPAAATLVVPAADRAAFSRVRIVEVRDNKIDGQSHLCGSPGSNRTISHLC